MDADFSSDPILNFKHHQRKLQRENESKKWFNGWIAGACSLDKNKNFFLRKVPSLSELCPIAPAPNLGNTILSSFQNFRDKHGPELMKNGYSLQFLALNSFMTPRISKSHDEGTIQGVPWGDKVFSL